MAAPQITLFYGQVPLRTQDQDTFNNNVADFVSWWPNAIPEANTAFNYVNTEGQAISDISQSTQSIAQSVVSAANFKGEWSSLTGALTVPSTVYHSGSYWQLLDDIPDVTASEPTLVNTDWAPASQAAGRTLISAPFTLTIAGRYYITGAGTITIPDPATMPIGTSFDFATAIGIEPVITAGNDNIKTVFGLYTNVTLDAKGVELNMYNNKWEI